MNMKTLIAIPTYWGREIYDLNGQQLPVYDHPTPVDEYKVRMKQFKIHAVMSKLGD